MNDAELRTTLLRLDCNLQITQVLLQELIAVLPQGGEVLERFQRAIEGMTKNAPKDADPEYLVELQARAAQTVVIATQALKAASA